MKYYIEFIIKSNESFAENEIKSEIEELLLKYKQWNNIREHGNCKTNEPHKFVLNLSQKLNSRSSNKHVALQNIYLLHVKKYKKTV